MIGRCWEPNSNYWARPKRSFIFGTQFGSSWVESLNGSYFLGSFFYHCGIIESK